MDKFHWILLVNKHEKKRTQLRIHKAGLLSGDQEHKTKFQIKGSVWNLFELFYDLNKVISFVTLETLP